MVQKYQVFINDHLLSIVEKVESNQQFNSELFLNKASDEDLITIVKWLLNESQRFFVGLIAEEQESMWEFFETQFLLIEAAGGLVKNNSNDYLFINRLGKWDIPKGKIELNETPSQAALREVEEECGISNLILGKVLAPTYHMYEQNGALCLKKTYWFEMTYSGNEKLVPQTEEGIKEVCWVAANDMGKQKSNTYASLMAIINEID